MLKQLLIILIAGIFFLGNLHAQHFLPAAQLPGKPASGTTVMVPDMPSSMNNYQNIGWIRSEDYLKHLFPKNYDINSKLNSHYLFPDSCLYYVLESMDTVVSNNTSLHAIGNSCDPYSYSYDKDFRSGIFPTPSWPAVKTYGYKMDSIKVCGYYHWGESDRYNPESPDTLRIFLAYHKVYEQIDKSTEWVGLYFATDYPTMDTNLFAPLVKVDTLNLKQPYGSALSPAAKSNITINYLLTAGDTAELRDSVLSNGDTIWFFQPKTYSIPITSDSMGEEGFAVPAGAVTSCMVKFIPGYTYRLGDTLVYARTDTNGKYSHNCTHYRHNCFSVIYYYDSNPRAYCDPYGYNFNYSEPKNTRYQLWTKYVPSSGGGKLYNSMYYASAQFMLLIAYHIAVDSSNIVEVCDSLYYHKVHDGFDPFPPPPSPPHPDSNNINDANFIITSIYPNPAKDYVVVSLKNNDPATIRVINVMGQVMKTVYTTEEKSRISTKDLSAGIYFLSVEQNGRRFTTKFSKQ